MMMHIMRLFIHALDSRSAQPSGWESSAPWDIFREGYPPTRGSGSVPASEQQDRGVGRLRFSVRGGCCQDRG